MSAKGDANPTISMETWRQINGPANRVTWEETKWLREALYYSRLDHDGKHPPHTGSMHRIEQAEAELQRLLGHEGAFSYLGSPADQRAWEAKISAPADAPSDEQ